MFDAFAFTKAFQDLSLLTLPVLRDQFINRFTDHFFRTIAEYTFSRVVPACDHAFKCFTDDRIITGSNDGGQLGALFFCPFLFRYIQYGPDKPFSGSAGTFIYLAIYFDPACFFIIEAQDPITDVIFSPAAGCYATGDLCLNESSVFRVYMLGKKRHIGQLAGANAIDLA